MVLIMHAGKLSGKIALVTGAGSGIGRESALLFAREGARIIVADNNEATGQETASFIQSGGGGAIFLKADVSDGAQVRELFQVGIAHFGGLDILFNCAGIWSLTRDVPVAELDEDTWDAIIATNLRGTFLCSKYAVKHMLKHGGGCILNMSSLAGLVGTIQHAYSASKGGVQSLTRSIALVYAPYNIRANVICPGFVETPINKLVQEDPKWREHFVSKIPLGRPGQANEVARLALFLASSEASYITGAVLPIDGGRYTV